MIEKKKLISEKICQIYPKKCDEVLSHLTEKMVSFRPKTMEGLEKLKKQGFELDTAVIENAYIVKKAPIPLSQTEEFKNGEIYIQGLSSMLPVIALNPKPNEQILELCAAPGSKTIQIAELTSHTAHITAVENNRSRFFALKSNLEQHKVTTAVLLLANAVGLDRDHPELAEKFDKVLADVPCSNEALINFEDPNTYKFWNSKTAKRLSKLQKALLATAIRLAKPGGTIVYSTCTFSVEENEMVVDWALKKFPNVRLDNLVLPITNVIPGFLQFKEKTLNANLSKTVRVIPDKNFTGFYIAKLTKITDSSEI